ncbi:hypothetical protein PAMC26510_33750 [Caballeronia sordidicola]|nr:hypothetical protein PAMC26510_33750 [Caballeronia sordidicola]
MLAEIDRFRVSVHARMPDRKALRLVHLANLPKFRLAGRRALPSNHTAAFAACLLKSMVDPCIAAPGRSGRQNSGYTRQFWRKNSFVIR